MKQAGAYLPYNKLPWIIESVPEPGKWVHLFPDFAETGEEKQV
jgi:hypothetical protein